MALANDIGRFFVRKIERIRFDIDAVDVDQSARDVLPDNLWVITHSYLVTSSPLRKRMRKGVQADSYLTNRSRQRIALRGSVSNSFPLPQDVSQGSLLGPLLFTIYTSKLFQVIKNHPPDVHAYANDA